METRRKTYHEEHPEMLFAYPHAACVKLGSFRRSRVRPSLSEEWPPDSKSCWIVLPVTGRNRS